MICAANVKYPVGLSIVEERCAPRAVTIRHCTDRAWILVDQCPVNNGLLGPFSDEALLGGLDADVLIRSFGPQSPDDGVVTRRGAGCEQCGLKPLT